MDKRICFIYGAKIPGVEDESDPANYYCDKCLEELLDMADELDTPHPR